MPIATAHRPAIARTPKSPTFLPYSTVPVTQPPAVSLNLGLLFVYLHRRTVPPAKSPKNGPSAHRRRQSGHVVPLRLRRAALAPF